jgi:hypothetical protein
MPFVKQPYPDWSWSLSRQNVLDECPRRYFYTYYASHNGWLKESSSESQVIYKLKQIKNLYLIFGESLHLLAEKIVKLIDNKCELPSDEEMVKELRGMLNKAYKDSLDSTLWASYPKKKTMLHEIYYHGRLPESVTNKIKERIYICVDNLLKTATIQDLQNSISTVVEIEKLSTVYVQNTKVFVKLDLLYTLNSEWIICDWKTGYENEKNDIQAKLYAYYVHMQYGIPLEEVKIRTEYLLTKECSLDSVTLEDIAQLEKHIKESILKMQSMLFDEDGNVPLPSENFKPTTNPSNCLYCNFREICDIKLM